MLVQLWHRTVALYCEWRLRQLEADCRRSGVHPSRSPTYHYTRKHWEVRLDAARRRLES